MLDSYTRLTEDSPVAPLEPGDVPSLTGTVSRSFGP